MSAVQFHLGVLSNQLRTNKSYQLVQYLTADVLDQKCRQVISCTSHHCNDGSAPKSLLPVAPLCKYKKQPCLMLYDEIVYFTTKNSF